MPLVKTTDLAGISIPIEVRIPHTFPSFINSPPTISCQKSTFLVSSSMLLHTLANSIRSFWVLGLHIAGPLLLLSIRNCTMLLSLTIPLYPPSASISRTICPLAMPPMAGLQLIWAMVCMFMVTSSTLLPILAAAAAASHPA